MPAKHTGTQGLQPAAFWRHFQELSRVPRISGQEEKIRKHIIEKAEHLKLAYRVDAAGNLVVRKPASKGHAAWPAVVLQCHLDMVCEKRPDIDFDFETDPIELIRDKDWLRADGTTLGADNGVGMALCLAFLENDNIRHGPLECLFTVAEEIGLIGAHAVTPETISGRILINLDSENISTFYIGCAGSRFTVIHLPLAFEEGPLEGRRCRLAVSGLKGGHSGLDIHRGRANAVKLLARLLAEVRKRHAFRLMDVKAGNSLNAIPAGAQAQGLLPASDRDGFMRTVSAMEAGFKAEFRDTESALTIGVEIGEGRGGPVLREIHQERMINLLLALPHGIGAMEELTPGLVKTSTNLATLGVENGRLKIGTKQRSSDSAEICVLSDSIRACAALAGATVEIGGDYPGWKPDPNSKLLAFAESTYERLLGKKPMVTAIHAGLECGLLTAKIDDLDSISIGATIRDAHSPRESLHISSVQTLWDLVAGLLSDIGKY